MCHLSGLCILVSFSLFLAWSNGELNANATGLLKDMNFTIQEHAAATRIYQFNKTKDNSVTFSLTGETDGIIGITPDTGILHLKEALDREIKAIYNFKIQTLDNSNRIVEGPYSIKIVVEDINDNSPIFNESAYTAVVRERSRPGKPFKTVYATDADDPATPNAQLSYSIFRQIPDMNKVMLFVMNSVTGEISTTSEGYRQLDSKKNSQFELRVEVQDLAGLSINAFTHTSRVMITVTESLWKVPDPVDVKENSTEMHPINITQVRCNEPIAKYELLKKEKLDWFPFSIDQKGDIFVTEPLDRERKSMYVFSALAKDSNGNWLERPVDVVVNVIDINDNPPVCQQAWTRFEVQENEGIGSLIGTLVASDLDEEPILHYKILDQIPKIPQDNMFGVSEYTGNFQLTRTQLQKTQASQYNVSVEVSDEANPPEQVLKTVCYVQINVIDVNSHIPIFERFDYGSLTFPENIALGSVILAIQATDDDEPYTGSSAIVYEVTEGAPSGVFLIETDAKTNRGYVKINKPLDFETFPEYNIVVQATNPEPLKTGVSYNEQSKTHFRIKVTNVDEAPIFNSTIYQKQVSEDIPVGTKLITVAAYDPEGAAIRYSLSEDKRNWLRIDPASGDIFSADSLDRETEASYMVNVFATEIGKSSMQSYVAFFLTLDDVNDNSPRLARDYSATFFCYPVTKKETVVIEATDPDSFKNGPRFTFSLGNDATVGRDWEIVGINMTHATLTMKHTDFEVKQNYVPIKIKDRGIQPMVGEVYIPVNICTCSGNNGCHKGEVIVDDVSPSVTMIIGIVVGALGLIGIIIGAVFISLNHKKKKAKKAQASDAKTQSEMQNLEQ